MEYEHQPIFNYVFQLVFVAYARADVSRTYKVTMSIIRELSKAPENVPSFNNVPYNEELRTIVLDKVDSMEIVQFIEKENAHRMLLIFSDAVYEKINNKWESVEERDTNTIEIIQ